MSWRRLPLAGPLDLALTAQPLLSGRYDPTQRLAPGLWLRATRTPEGPAAISLQHEGDALRAEAHGPGAGWVLDRAADLAGLADPGPGSRLEAAPELRAFARGARGLRLARTHRVAELLVVIVLQQLVSGKESKRAFTGLVKRFSEPAPGPFELWLPLGAEQLRALPPAEMPPLGILGRQGETLRRVGEHARRIEETFEMEPVAALRRLLAVRGIGPWTANLALLHGFGCADAVPVGDLHLPTLIAHNLAQEGRADDARMLALLAPYAGQRGRVVRWIATAGTTPARRAPRQPVRDLRHI